MEVIKYNNVVLPVHPPMTSYTPVSNAFLSVLQNENCPNDIYENFIGISYRRDFLKKGWCEFRGYYDRTAYSSLDCINLDINHTEISKIDISLKIMEAISAKYYVLLQIDSFYISSYINYNKTHLPHIIFVYGYDKDKKKFYVKDFFDYRIYTSTVIDFSELDQGYLNFRKFQFQDFLGILVFKQKSDVISNRIDYVKICRSMAKLLQPVSDDDLYDLNSLPYYINQLYAFTCKIDEREEMPLRLFNFLFSHIELMQNRVIYFSKIDYYDMSYFVKEIKKIFQLINICRSYAFKYNYIMEQGESGVKEKSKIVERLCVLSSEYPQFLLQLFEHIENIW